MPNTFSPTNAQRADRMYRALLHRYEFQSCPEGAVIDALTDLRHLCDEYGVRWGNVEWLAACHYGQEVAEATEAAR